MGTRHIIMVELQDEYKVAQYGQWDGYFSGQGVNVLNAMRGIYNTHDPITPIDFKINVSKLKAISEEELRDLWTQAGADPESSLVNMVVAGRFQKKYPHFDRDCSSDVLLMIANDEIDTVNLDVNFPYDSLFCEYVYVINLDTDELEIYTGFNKEPLDKSERFYQEGNVKPAYEGASTYYGCKLFHTYDLNNLPTEEDFIKELTTKEEEMDNV